MAMARDRTQHEYSMPSLIHHQDESANNSVINFKTLADHHHHHHHVNGSSVSNLLSFEQHKPQLIPHRVDDYSMWEENLITTDQSSSDRLFDDFTCSSNSKHSTAQEGPFSWLYSDAPSDYINDSSSLPQESSFLHKRPLSGENSSMPVLKKQCTKKTKQKADKSSSGATTTTTTTIAAAAAAAAISSSKDPQSIAAKNRRERISERLKTLQELVPNGTKVDLVTMLEKAISYVKFLQLQVKVLATDEFWPVQGGKAPDISQVKEAIDAILSSQRDSRNSSSSSKS